MIHAAVSVRGPEQQGDDDRRREIKRVNHLARIIFSKDGRPQDAQAAAEGARAAAVAPPYLDGAARIPIAKAAVNEAFEGQIGPAVSCDSGRLTCVVVPTASCTTPPCRVKVELRYLYRGDPNRDVMPHIFGNSVNPLPVTLTYTASARWK